MKRSGKQWSGGVMEGWSTGCRREALNESITYSGSRRTIMSRSFAAEANRTDAYHVTLKETQVVQSFL
jgi:hypothetical protein